MAEDGVTGGDIDGSGGRGISLSVFFPCYNEEANVAGTAEKALSVPVVVA